MSDIKHQHPCAYAVTDEQAADLARLDHLEQRGGEANAHGLAVVRATYRGHALAAVHIEDGCGHHRVVTFGGGA